MSSFSELGVDKWLVDACATLEIFKPTPVQAACIPPALAGRDVIGAAETGTGKTLAFALPVFQKLAEDPRALYGVFVTPTRELALQIGQVLGALGTPSGLRHHVLVGGVDQLYQAAAISRERPHTIVCTPGRLALLIRSGELDLAPTRSLILDEADRLLDPSYLEDLKTILRSCSSSERQTSMFSATMTPTLKTVQTIAVGQNAFRFDARKNRFATVTALTQRYIFLPEHLMECHLVHCLKNEFPKESVMIFVSRCQTAEFLVSVLNLLGMKKVVAIHSDMKQTKRLEALEKFKGGTVRALVATDLASRGLDMPMCELVINYNLHSDPAVYVHRVGRTARAGREGQALSFVTEKDVKLVHAIEKKLGKKLEKYEYQSRKNVMGEVGLTLKAKQLANLSLEDSGFIGKVDSRRAERRKMAKRRHKALSKGNKK